jgi:hypothetical protein
MTLEALAQEIRTLSLEERKQLVTLILETFTDVQDVPVRDILEFEGIGARLYDGTDAQAYVNQLRSEWDERP